jgi:hypothetical protein
MKRRAALFGSGAALLGGTLAIASTTDSQPASYDVDLGIQPGKADNEFLCTVSLHSGETGHTQQTDGSFKQGTTGTLRTGQGRADGSSIDLLVEVTVDASGSRAKFVATVSDRGTVVTTQRTSVALAKA